MTDFKQGDRAVYKNNLSGNSNANGATGTIVGPGYLDGEYTVEWDAGSAPALPVAHPFTENLTLIPASLTRDDIDALPVGAVIKDSDGDTYERRSDTLWARTPDAKWGPMDRQSNWDHHTVRSLADAYAPVTRVSQPEHAVEPTPDLATRLAALDAEIATYKSVIQDEQAVLDDRRRDLNRKTTLAAQYRAVLADLENQK